MKELFTMAECMEQLQLKESAIQKKLRSGELNAIYKKTPTGRVRYITVASVARYIRNHSKEVKADE